MERARIEAGLPPPSAELVLLSVLVQTMLQTMPKKKRAAFVKELGTAMQWQTEFANVIRIRPASQDAEVARARDQASTWLLRAIAVFECGVAK